MEKIRGKIRIGREEIGFSISKSINPFKAFEELSLEILKNLLKEIRGEGEEIFIGRDSLKISPEKLRNLEISIEFEGIEIPESFEVGYYGEIYLSDKKSSILRIPKSLNEYAAILIPSIIGEILYEGEIYSENLFDLMEFFLNSDSDILNAEINLEFLKGIEYLKSLFLSLYAFREDLIRIFRKEL